MLEFLQDELGELMASYFPPDSVIVRKGKEAFERHCPRMGWGVGWYSGERKARAPALPGEERNSCAPPIDLRGDIVKEAVVYSQQFNYKLARCVVEFRKSP